MKYLAEINFTMKESHPDKQYVHDWTPDKVFSFSDTYSFDEGIWNEDMAKAYMKEDLKMIAGGGYNCDHIENVKFNFKVN